MSNKAVNINTITSNTLTASTRVNRGQIPIKSPSYHDQGGER